MTNAIETVAPATNPKASKPKATNPKAQSKAKAKAESNSVNASVKASRETGIKLNDVAAELSHKSFEAIQNAACHAVFHAVSFGDCFLMSDLMVRISAKDAMAFKAYFLQNLAKPGDTKAKRFGVDVQLFEFITKQGKKTVNQFKFKKLTGDDDVKGKNAKRKIKSGGIEALKTVPWVSFKDASEDREFKFDESVKTLINRTLRNETVKSTALSEARALNNILPKAKRLDPNEFEKVWNNANAKRNETPAKS